MVQPVVEVGPFRVANLSSDAVVHAVATRDPNQRYVALALHVGGLNARKDVAFVQAMNGANLTYADGAAVVLLGRLAGARRLERAPTTDIGVPLVAAECARLGHAARVAIIGGEQGVADRAGAELARQSGCEIVFSTHGYHDAYEEVLSAVRAENPDVLIVGLGMPREALWIRKNLQSMPSCLVFSCGGWLGFLAGNERRAPRWQQRAGLEWLYRLSQAPLRLLGRYALGLLTVVALIPQQAIAHRVR